MPVEPQPPQQIQPILIRSQFAPSLDDVLTDFVQELTGDYSPVTLEELIDMCKRCPISRAALELKSLRAGVLLGEYHHPDPKPYPTAAGYMTITEWVRGNFETMRGSLRDYVSKAVRQVYGLGHSCGEVLWEPGNGYGKTEARLAGINVLNPLRYNFAGRLGNIDRLIYRSTYQPLKAIPYQKIIHVYNPAVDEPDDPRGDPQSARAYPYYKARRLMLKQWAGAGQRQAVGLTIIQVNSEDTVPVRNKDGTPKVDTDGRPIIKAAPFAAADEAKQIESGGVFVTDLKNKIMNLPGSGGENFFNIALTYFQKQIFYAYGVPSTIFDDTASGIGNSGVNAGHRLVLDNQIEAIVISMRDQILEKIIQPLLVYNFGDRFRGNYGYFKTEQFMEPSMAATRVSNLTIAITNGLIDATDLEANNRLRLDLGLSPLTKEEFDRIQLAKLLQAQEQYSLMSNE